MTWNYRIILHDEDRIKYYAIHEVFYDKKGKPEHCTTKPIDIVGDDVKEVRDITRMIMKDAKAPPIKYSYFFSRKKKCK